MSTPLPGHHYPMPPRIALPAHPRARVALVLGVVGAGGFFLALPLLAGPLAWYFGAAARREIVREPGRWDGHGEATAGLVLGIVSTAMLALLLLGLALVAGTTSLLLGHDSGYGT